MDCQTKRKIAAHRPEQAREEPKRLDSAGEQ